MNKEPAVITGFVAAVIALAVSFGLPLTGEQIGSINAVVVILAGFFIRSQVTPVSKVTDAGLNPATMQPGPTTDPADGPSRTVQPPAGS